MKYDWDRAVRERKEDALRLLKWACDNAHRFTSRGDVLIDVERVMSSARVQTVAEADRAYVDWYLSAGCHGSVDRGLLDECRQAREREKGGKT